MNGKGAHCFRDFFLCLSWLVFTRASFQCIFVLVPLFNKPAAWRTPLYAISMYLLEVPLKYYPKTHPHLTSSSSSSNIFLPVIINFSFCIIRQNNANKNKYEMVHFFFMIFNNILRHQLLFFRLFSSSLFPLRYFTLRCTTAPPLTTLLSFFLLVAHLLWYCK